ncbi:retrovirus-related Pol polyprotein from transposon 17.6 [Nephila pilipes]|uniref:Retrovirus-related Pol polyprotein from transposon 17.6 n=1 Tax=Nephila pilipes TaxID=299642 RepID=A0A8X6TDQ8_NEPPI|nr:retrovirus-related Pol polyprotein from transposon 17.6 [Nephila pilipes]
MKVGLQKKSQLLENRNKIWVKSASSTAEHENTVSSRNQQFSRKPFPRINNNRSYATKQQEDRPPVMVVELLVSPEQSVQIAQQSLRLNRPDSNFWKQVPVLLLQLRYQPYTCV